VERLELNVTDEESGKRLDEFLALRLGGLSRMRIARLISQGMCSVNAVAKEAGMRVFAGDLVELRSVNSGPSAMTPEQIPLDIIFEDDYIIVLAKPAGMLVHPTVGVKTGTLSNALAFHLNKKTFIDRTDQELGAEDLAALGRVRPGIVHRLDRATSGLLAVAKTQHALTVLSRHFRKGLVKKRYLALVQGGFEAAEGLIAAPIGRDPDRRPHWWIMDNGKPAETKWRVLGGKRDTTLLELEPVTGRTNQLRIHLAHLGRPILGDTLYGSSMNAGDEGGSERLLLHAWRLAFHHPETGDWHQFTSAPPAELISYLGTLGIPEPEPTDLPM